MPEHKIRVLLIEDTLSDAQILQRMLAKSKLPLFEVSHVTDLGTGVRALERENFDVVLLDLGLPDSTGATAVARLRTANPEMPAIVLTVVEKAQTILDAIKMGAQDYFVKSRLDADELTNKIIDAVVWRQVRSGGPLAEAAANRIGGKIVRLLVVEDNAADAALLSKMLASIKLLRFEIIEATSFAAAVPLLVTGVDLVLLDLNLGDTHGLDTLRRLRRHDDTTPIIVLTGTEDRQVAVAALEQGAQDFLVKGQVDGFLIGQSLLRQLRKSTTASP